MFKGFTAAASFYCYWSMLWLLLSSAACFQCVNLSTVILKIHIACTVVCFMCVCVCVCVCVPLCVCVCVCMQIFYSLIHIFTFSGALKSFTFYVCLYVCLSLCVCTNFVLVIPFSLFQVHWTSSLHLSTHCAIKPLKTRWWRYGSMRVQGQLLTTSTSCNCLVVNINKYSLSSVSL